MTRKLNERIEILLKNGYTNSMGVYYAGINKLTSEQISKQTDEDFNLYLQLGQDELKRVEAELDRKKLETERLASERKKLDEEREQIAKERAELAKLKAEIRADKTIVDEKIEKLDPKPTQHEEIKIASNAIAKTGQSVSETVSNVRKSLSVEVTKRKTPHTPEQKMKLQFFNLGFENFRVLFTDAMNDEKTKRTRKDWLQWANDLKPQKQ